MDTLGLQIQGWRDLFAQTTTLILAELRAIWPHKYYVGKITLFLLIFLHWELLLMSSCLEEDLFKGDLESKLGNRYQLGKYRLKNTKFLMIGHYNLLILSIDFSSVSRHKDSEEILYSRLYAIHGYATFLQIEWLLEIFKLLGSLIPTNLNGTKMIYRLNRHRCNSQWPRIN